MPSLDFQPLETEEEKPQFDFQPVDSGRSFDFQPVESEPQKPAYTMADFMSGDRFKTKEERDAAWKEFRTGGGHIPTVNEVGWIPKEAFQAALTYGNPVGLMMKAQEAIAPNAVVPKIVKGATAGASEALAGFTTPDNLQTLAAMPAGKLAQTLIAAGFEAEAIRGVPDQIKAYGETDDPAEKAKIATGIAVSLGLPVLGAVHAAFGQQSPKTESLPTAKSQSPPGTPEGSTQEISRRTNANDRSDTQSQPESKAPSPEIASAEKFLNEPEGVGEPPKAAEPLPTEEPSAPSVTSTKNEQTALERENRGIAPALESATREDATAWVEAEKIHQADPTAPQRLVDSLIDNPRAVTDVENHLLLRRQIELQNEHDAAVKAVNEATDAATKQDAIARLDKARDEVQRVYDADKIAGRQTGLGLRARQIMAANDFSLTRMESTWRAVANEGKPLSPKQTADVKALHEEIARTREKLAAYEAKEQFEIELKKARTEARKAGGFKIQSFLDQQARAARERITARRGKLFADPIGVTSIAHLADEAIIGASHIARGVTKFADWSKQMIAEFGERIKPHLKALFTKANLLHADAAKRGASGLTEAERVERALAGDKKAILTRTAKLQEKVAAGDFAKPEKQPPRMDKEKARLLYEYEKAKEAYNRGLFDAKLKQQSVPRKVLRYGGEAINTARAVMTSMDFSAVLRQGGFIALGHPFRALKNFPDMFRAFASERAQHRINAEIMQRPNAPLYVKAKLFLVDESATSLAKMEEVYMSRLANKIPLVAGSQRAYITFLNKLRADSFDAMANGLGRKGAVTNEEAKAIASYINVATGRGEVGAGAQWAVGLNTLFFAPRLVISRFQLLAGQPLYKGSWRTRRAVAAEYARFLAGAATVYALGASAGAEISGDATSPDFLKLRFGDTRLDPLSGLIQATVFSAREAKAIQRFATQSNEKKPPYGSGGDVLVRFLRTKLAPAPGSIWSAIEGKDVVGQKVTPWSLVASNTVPMSFNDIYKAMEEQGVPKGAALGILSVFGAGLNTYRKKTNH